MDDSERLRQSVVALSDAQQIEHTILDGIEAHVYLKSADLRYLYANRQVIETLNLSRDQVIGHTDSEIFPQHISAQLKILDAQVFATGQKHTGEETTVTPDGRTLYFWSTKMLLQRSGKEDCLVGYSVDITRLKQTESELRQSNKALFESDRKFRQAFENANSGMCLVDLKGNLIEVNDKMSEIFGFSKAELETMAVNDLALNEDITLSPQFIEHAVHGDADRAMFEKRYRHKDGHIVFGIVSSTLIHDQQGNPQFFVSHVQDITASKKIESELRVSEERHRLLIENASDIIWTLKPDGSFGHFGRPVMETLGYSVVEASQMRFDQFLEPESIVVANEYLTRMRQDIESGRVPSSFRGELLQRRKDGSSLWTEVLAYPITDNHGQLVEILGVTRNIDERKRHDLELKHARDEAQAAEAALETAISELEAVNAELMKLASTDPLTSAENRRQFEITMANHIALAKRRCEPVCLVMFDIDHFKRINDGYGHLAGDKVLVELSGIVLSALRASDTFCRWGGEEFLILLPDCSKENARSIADKLRQRFEQHVFAEVGHVTASFGVTQWQPDESVANWIKRVDKAMYAAKDAGRNTVYAV
jgi:diguanylate cyclase (GGDEF)-like protein/PAS domain S-box-containing protein